MRKLLSLVVLGWVAIALFIQLTFVVLSFVSPRRADELARQAMHRLDGTFSN